MRPAWVAICLVTHIAWPGHVKSEIRNRTDNVGAEIPGF